MEYTLPYEAVIKDGTKYLTNVEMQIVLDIAINIGMSNMNEVFEVLLKLCEQMEVDEGISEHIAAWETIMINIANVYGEMAEYSKSNSVCYQIIQEDVHCYRMNLLEFIIYNIAWNEGEKRKKNIPVEKGYEEVRYINNCIALGQSNKNYISEMIAKKHKEQL